MDLSRFQHMDPDLLVGILNTELRNHREDLDELCGYHDIPRPELEAHLAQSGYTYRPELNQFR
jgi:hypothetical protein